MTIVYVKAAYDPDAKVWSVEKSSLPGVFAEGETVDELASKLPNIVEDLTGTRSQIEFEAHMLVSCAGLRARRSCAARRRRLAVPKARQR
jgi:predicted RNase H-like HicB family nuclease